MKHGQMVVTTNPIINKDTNAVQAAGIVGEINRELEHGLFHSVNFGDGLHMAVLTTDLVDFDEWGRV